MLPGPANVDVADGRHTHPESSSNRTKRLASSNSTANDGNIRCRKDRSRTHRAALPASFSGHVGEILGARSEKEMGRIAARTIVAAMADAKTLRYWPDRQNVSGPMRPHRALKNASVTVAGIGEATNPRPAFISRTAVNRFPKLRRVSVFVRHGQPYLKSQHSQPDVQP